MGRPDTKHVEGGGGRVRWANQSERISGMNNPTSLKDTTVFPDRRPQRGLANFKEEEEKGRKDLSKEALREKGPLSEQQCTVNPKLIERQFYGKPHDIGKRVENAKAAIQAESGGKLTLEGRKQALNKATIEQGKDQAAQRAVWEAEKDPKKQKQLALKAGIEQADFRRHTARESADITAQEKGAQSPQTLKAKSEVRAADKAYNQGVADWHKRSVRDNSYEPFDKKWSNEAERAKARESKSKDPQEKKDAALERQFNTTAGHGKGHGM
jgi:hypothetical protein